MKKLPAVLIGLLVLGTAGWSGLWYAGRDEIGARIDREFAQLRAQGFGIEHGAREIGGFPFGYKVTHHDVTVKLPGAAGTKGASYLLPEISTEVSAADVERLVTRFPAKFRIEAPVPSDSRAAAPELPESVALDIEAQDLLLVSDGVPGVDQELTITAGSLLMVTATAIQDVNVAIEMQGLASEISLPPRGSGLPAKSRSTTKRMEYAYAVVKEGGQTASLEGTVEDLRVTGSTDIGNAADAMLTFLTKGAGNWTAAYQTGASSGILRAVQGQDQPPRTFSFASGSTAGTVALVNGQAEINAAAQANRMVWSQPGPAAAPATSTDAEAPTISLGGEMRAVELQYAAPFAPAAEMAPVTLRLALDQFTLDPALWERIDAKGLLPRDPGRLVIDIKGTARITAPLDAQRPGTAPPVELGNFSIRAADLTALGAGLTARGDIEFLPPIHQPVGKVKVTLTNAMRLLGKLAEAGLIDQAIAQTGMLMATGFTRPGAAEGERVAEIELGLDGISVNGQPMWQ